MASSSPAMLNRSASGKRLKLLTVAKAWPSGLGNWGPLPNTGAVASSPSGDQKALVVKGVNTSRSPSSAVSALMLG